MVFVYKTCCILLCVVFISLLVPLNTKRRLCPEQWRRFIFECYRVYTTKGHFVTGDDFCFNLNGGLVAITTEKINTYIQNMIKESGVTEVYIGLVYNEDEERYDWGENKNLTFTNWKTEPVTSPTDPNRLDCVLMKLDGLWYTADCTTMAGYVCQQPIQKGMVCGREHEGEYDLVEN